MNHQIKIELSDDTQTQQPIFIAWANSSADNQSQMITIKQEEDLMIIKEDDDLLFIKDEDDMEIIELSDSEDEEKSSITLLNSIQFPTSKISHQLSMALTNQTQKSLKPLDQIFMNFGQNQTISKNQNSSNNQQTTKKRHHSSVTTEFDSVNPESKKRKLSTDQIQIIPYIPETYPPRRSSTDSNSSKHTSYSTGSSSSTNNSSEHQCNICMATFKRNIDLRHHSTSHLEAKIECKRCGMKFKFQVYLQKHKCITCNLCEETFFEQRQLKAHQMNVHTKKTKHQCNICKTEFNRKNELINHLSSHSEAKFECQRCRMKFKHEGNFKKHECIACDLCGEIFSTQKQLRIHLVNVHDISTHMFECDICGKKLNERSQIEEHIIKMHMKDESKFECDFCGKRFKLKSSLRKHIKLNEVVIECKLCDKKIKKASLYSHMKQVHATERNFECKICLASFKTGPSLKLHMGIHEMNFECTKCGKRFPSKYILKEHEKWHKNPEVYKCKICEKTFQLKSKLNRHVKLHESGNLIRIFKCTSCTYSTEKVENLKKHELSHKRKEEKTEKTKNWLQCEKCPLKLKNKLKLAAHYWKKHNEE